MWIIWFTKQFELPRIVKTKWRCVLFLEFFFKHFLNFSFLIWASSVLCHWWIFLMQAVEWENMAFIFLNRFLDLADVSKDFWLCVHCSLMRIFQMKNLNITNHLKRLPSYSLTLQTLQSQRVGSLSFFFLRNILFSEDGLNWSKVTGKTFILLKNIFQINVLFNFIFIKKILSSTAVFIDDNKCFLSSKSYYNDFWMIMWHWRVMAAEIQLCHHINKLF